MAGEQPKSPLDAFMKDVAKYEFPDQVARVLMYFRFADEGKLTEVDKMFLAPPKEGHKAETEDEREMVGLRNTLSLPRVNLLEESRRENERKIFAGYEQRLEELIRRVGKERAAELLGEDDYFMAQVAFGETK